MHGDDVASAGVSVATQIVSKATEILLDMLKVAIEKEREAARLKQSENQQTVLSGGEVTYQKLKEGGEVTMLPSFAKEDYGEFLKRAKEMDIPVAAIQEHGKGELLRSTGKMLESYGYKIKVFNLIDMAHSHNYNPFNYIYDVDGNYSATAVIKMVNVLMKNTSKEGGGGGDQFWDDSTKALLAALCFYLVECEDKSMQNFSEVMKLLKKAEVKEGSDDYQSDLDLIFDALEFPDKYKTEEAEHNEQFKSLNLIDLAKTAKPANRYMCLKYYKDFKKAAGDTAKSILISTAVRLQAFNIPEVMDLTCCDNIHLEIIGDEKTVMYIIIPSSDDTFNFLAAMMYTQLFDVLYDRANFKHGGRLPFHVRCLLDEFANVGTIPRFEELLATMRSMEISANVIIQNLSQLKKMYKDKRKLVDTFVNSVYLYDDKVVIIFNCREGASTLALPLDDTSACMRIGEPFTHNPNTFMNNDVFGFVVLFLFLMRLR